MSSSDSSSDDSDLIPDKPTHLNHITNISNEEIIQLTNKMTDLEQSFLRLSTKIENDTSKKNVGCFEQKVSWKLYKKLFYILLSLLLLFEITSHIDHSVSDKKFSYPYLFFDQPYNDSFSLLDQIEDILVSKHLHRNNDTQLSIMDKYSEYIYGNDRLGKNIIKLEDIVNRWDAKRIKISMKIPKRIFPTLATRSLRLQLYSIPKIYNHITEYPQLIHLNDRNNIIFNNPMYTEHKECRSDLYLFISRLATNTKPTKFLWKSKCIRQFINRCSETVIIYSRIFLGDTIVNRTLSTLKLYFPFEKCTVVDGRYNWQISSAGEYFVEKTLIDIWIPSERDSLKTNIKYTIINNNSYWKPLLFVCVVIMLILTIRGMYKSRIPWYKLL